MNWSDYKYFKIIPKASVTNKISPIVFFYCSIKQYLHNNKYTILRKKGKEKKKPLILIRIIQNLIFLLNSEGKNTLSENDVPIEIISRVV